MISFSQIMVLLQTQAFWTSVLGYKINGESIQFFELFGMLICFAAALVIITSETTVGKNELIITEGGHYDDQILRNRSYTDNS